MLDEPIEYRRKRYQRFFLCLQYIGNRARQGAVWRLMPKTNRMLIRPAVQSRQTSKDRHCLPELAPAILNGLIDLPPRQRP
ncbi:hypothetical protein HOY34_15025 [Xinfangfangia sp. D13-10-4-6]|uniref:hypothetical protein n=1 Tax=Pseudogemmobacter hezensis TaxID=2737662 RepID=UPI001555A625|nr:hypothetical protein [Pseudogemmobacter hezensis]NPD16504.1 hypothetical protein [Pseudogemmobacter hezensis]